MLSRHNELIFKGISFLSHRTRGRNEAKIKGENYFLRIVKSYLTEDYLIPAFLIASAIVAVGSVSFLLISAYRYFF